MTDEPRYEVWSVGRDGNREVEGTYWDVEEALQRRAFLSWYYAGMERRVVGIYDLANPEAGDVSESLEENR